jgi:hypothetical protein
LIKQWKEQETKRKNNTEDGNCNLTLNGIVGVENSISPWNQSEIENGHEISLQDLS